MARSDHSKVRRTLRQIALGLYVLSAAALLAYLHDFSMGAYDGLQGPVQAPIDGGHVLTHVSSSIEYLIIDPTGRYADAYRRDLLFSGGALLIGLVIGFILRWRK